MEFLESIKSALGGDITVASLKPNVVINSLYVTAGLRVSNPGAEPKSLVAVSKQLADLFTAGDKSNRHLLLESLSGNKDAFDGVSLISGACKQYVTAVGGDVTLVLRSGIPLAVFGKSTDAVKNCVQDIYGATLVLAAVSNGDGTFRVGVVTEDGDAVNWDSGAVTYFKSGLLPLIANGAAVALSGGSLDADISDEADVPSDEEISVADTVVPSDEDLPSLDYNELLTEEPAPTDTETPTAGFVGVPETGAISHTLTEILSVLGDVLSELRTLNTSVSELCLIESANEDGLVFVSGDGSTDETEDVTTFEEELAGFDDIEDADADAPGNEDVLNDDAIGDEELVKEAAEELDEVTPDNEDASADGDTAEELVESPYYYYPDGEGDEPLSFDVGETVYGSVYAYDENGDWVEYAPLGTWFFDGETLSDATAGVGGDTDLDIGGDSDAGGDVDSELDSEPDSDESGLTEGGFYIQPEDDDSVYAFAEVDTAYRGVVYTVSDGELVEVAPLGDYYMSSEDGMVYEATGQVNEEDGQVNEVEG